MKIILVDAWNSFITESGVNILMQKLLDTFPNKKIILTNANSEERINLGIINLPYEVFSLSHNPNKTDGGYYEKMLEYFGFDKNDILYFEHNELAVEKARQVGINTYHYNKDKKDLILLEKFLRNNL